MYSTVRYCFRHEALFCMGLSRLDTSNARGLWGDAHFLAQEHRTFTLQLQRYTERLGTQKDSRVSLRNHIVPKIYCSVQNTTQVVSTQNMQNIGNPARRLHDILLFYRTFSLDTRVERKPPQSCSFLLVISTVKLMPFFAARRARIGS